MVVLFEPLPCLVSPIFFAQAPVSKATMATTAQTEKVTDYESRQMEEIAAWKSEYPNPFGELFRRAARPLARVVEHVIPDRIALVAIEAAYRASDLTATQGDIKLQAGVDD